MLESNLINSLNYKILDRTLKIKIFFLLIMIFIGSMLEAISIGAFFPFVEMLLGGKSGLMANKFANNNQAVLNFLSNVDEEKIVTFGLVVFAIVIFSKNIIVFLINYYREVIHCALRTSLE